MADIALSNTPTIIDNAESITNWGGDTFTLEPDIKVQGDNSVACTQTNNGINDVYVTGTWDFSATGLGDQHLRLWMNSSIVAPYGDIEANDGVQIFLYDGANTAYYTVGGSDTYAGGWKQWVVYSGNTPDSGTVTKSTITRIGIRINTTSKPRNITNGWYDAWTYGDGFIVTGGTSIDEITFSDVATADSSGAYGIVTEIDGVIFLSGDIKIGNGAETTYFNDTADIAVFKDLAVSSTLYKLTYQGSGCRISIAGGSYSAAGTQRFGFYADDSDLLSFSMDGKQLARLDSGYFKSGQTIETSVFYDCLQVTPSGSTFSSNIISNSTDPSGALSWAGVTNNVTSCDFINNSVGVEIPVSAAITFSEMVFDDVGGNYDINNSCGDPITISLTNSSNANSYVGNTVTFKSAINLSIHVVDTDGNDMRNATCYIEDSSQVELMNEFSDVNGEATQPYNYAGDENIVAKVRRYGYKAFRSTGTIFNQNLNITATMISDPQQT